MEQLSKPSKYKTEMRKKKSKKQIKRKSSKVAMSSKFRKKPQMLKIL